MTKQLELGSYGLGLHWKIAQCVNCLHDISFTTKLGWVPVPLQREGGGETRVGWLQAYIKIRGPRLLQLESDIFRSEIFLKNDLKSTGNHDPLWNVMFMNTLYLLKLRMFIALGCTLRISRGHPDIRIAKLTNLSYLCEFQLFPTIPVDCTIKLRPKTMLLWTSDRPSTVVSSAPISA